MVKPSKRSPERKLQVVLSVLRGEVSVAEAARRAGVAEQTAHNWKNAFLEAGCGAWRAPSGADRPGSSRWRPRTRNPMGVYPGTPPCAVDDAASTRLGQADGFRILP